MQNTGHFIKNAALPAVGCCLLWGSAFPMVKKGYAAFAISAQDTYSQILFAGSRFFIAGIFAIIFACIMERKIIIPTADGWKKSAILSLCQTILQYMFFYVGLAHTTGSKASVVGACNVFVAILIAALIFRQEKLTAGKAAGCILGFAGVILVNMEPGTFELNMALNGEGFILFSAVAYAFSSVLIKIFSETQNPVMLSGYQFAIGGAVMILWGAVMGGRLSPEGISAMPILLYLSFLSAAAYSVWGLLLKKYPVSKIVVFTFTTPVFGVLLSAFLLNETESIGFGALAALLCVCAGIYVVNRKSA